jgi:hypothetical protein
MCQFAVAKRAKPYDVVDLIMPNRVGETTSTQTSGAFDPERW